MTSLLSRLMIGGSAAMTTFVSDSGLRVTIPAEVTQNQMAVDVAVATPAPVGGTSGALSITFLPGGTVQSTGHPLVAQYDMVLPANSEITIEFGPDEQFGRKTWTRPAPAGGG